MSATITQLRDFLSRKLDVDVDYLQDDSPLFSGGVLDSFSVPELLDFVNERTGQVVRPVHVTPENFDSIARIARFIDELAAGEAPPTPDPVVILQPRGEGIPFFCVPGVGGNNYPFFTMAQHMGETQPVYGLQYPGMEGERDPLTAVEEIARTMVAQMKTVQKRGPYRFGGYSFGSLVAYEMARQLTAAGERVSFLAVWDGFAPGGKRRRSLLDRLRVHRDNLRALELQSKVIYLLERMSNIKRRFADEEPNRTEINRANRAALEAYQPGPYTGRLTLFRASALPESSDFFAIDPAHGWSKLAAAIEVVDVPGTHLEMLKEPHVRTLAAEMRARLSGSEDGHERETLFSRVAALSRRTDELAWMTWEGRRVLLCSGPSAIRHVLSTHAQKYRKSSVYEHVGIVMGEGLLTSEGESWRRQRRLVGPAFAAAKLAEWVPIMVGATSDMLARWRDLPDGPFDLAAEVNLLTVVIAGRALLSTDLTVESDDLGRLMREALQLSTERRAHYERQPLAYPSARHATFREAMRELDAMVFRLIETRRRLGPEHAPDDLMSTLVFARDPETGEALTDKELRDELMTFLIAGHETTANALAWTFYLLADHPEVEARLREESVRVLGNGLPTADLVPSLEHTLYVVKEAMRLYPPGWLLERVACEDDVLGGEQVAKGTLVMLSAYGAHRRPDLWPNPERFDPERFAPEGSAGRNPWAYLPFGRGPRQCIGQELALNEMRVVLSMVARDFRLERVEGHPVEPVGGVTLRPRHGILMTATSAPKRQ